MIQKGVEDYRPEIDGLRAFSVLLVVVFHLNPKWLPGGYIGVDIFCNQWLCNHVTDYPSNANG